MSTDGEETLVTFDFSEVNAALLNLPGYLVDPLLQSLKGGLEVADTEHHFAAGSRTRELNIRFQLPKSFLELMSAHSTA